MSVVSKTAETNAVTTYYVSALAGPRLNKRRVSKGDAVEMSEHQARGLLAAGELVADKADVDDPWGEAARAEAAQKAAAEAKAAADKEAAAADKAAKDAAEAAAAAGKKTTDKPGAGAPGTTTPAA